MAARALHYAAVALTLGLLTAACGGGGGGASTPPPTGASYALNPCAYRAGEPIAPNVAVSTGGVPTSWSVSPELPTGLSLDPLSGAVSGTPQVAQAQASYTVTASNAGGSVTEDLVLTVGPALPSAFLSLAQGFAAEPVASGVAKVAKLAIAPFPDERIFFTEVDSGNVRVIEPGTGLVGTPFVTIAVLGGGHRGLLGLALAPDFLQSGHVYVLACLDAAGLQSARMAVIRYTDVNNVATNATIVLDDLPVSTTGGINNGGEILFDASGRLLVSIGDLEDPANAQKTFSPADPTSLGGRILRFDVSSLPPAPDAGNANPLDPTLCKGLRNTFGLAIQPTTGGLFGVDNGLASDDELNFLQAGKNYEWGSAGGIPGSQVGYKMRNYQTEIVPTSVCWHDGTGWGAAYANNLFLGSYDDQKLRRFEVSGASFTDIDAETDFCELVLDVNDNKILDVCRGPDGSLYISTFVGIYRISRM